jgi:hypothetical protein
VKNETDKNIKIKEWWEQNIEPDEDDEHKGWIFSEKMHGQ